MRLLVLTTFFTISSLIATHAFAHPIFLKCGKDGELIDSFSPKEWSEILYSAEQEAKAQGKTKNIAESWCSGKAECFGELKQMAILSRTPLEVAEAMLEEELKKIAQGQKVEASPLIEISDETFKDAKKIHEYGMSLAACQETKKKIPMVTSDEKLLFYFPYHSEYTYVTGAADKYRHFAHLGPRDNQKGARFNWWDIHHYPFARSSSEDVEKCIAYGIDPLFFLGLKAMEGTSDLVNDPIGEITALGCSEVKKSDSDFSIQSYGNAHYFKTQVVQDPNKVDRLEKLNLLEVGTSGTDQKSGQTQNYLCFSAGEKWARYVEKPLKNACCLEMRNSSGKYIHSTYRFQANLVFESVLNLQNQGPLKGNSDPAFTFQRFNGFSKLMGGAEPVSHFRAGVNQYESPDYGYAAMNFYLRSFLDQSQLKQAIQSAENSQRKKSVSILCAQAKNKIFSLESDHYFKKHKNIWRLNLVVSKKWSDLTKREKHVASIEVGYPENKKDIETKFKKRVPYFTTSEWKYSENGKEVNRGEYDFRTASVKQKTGRHDPEHHLGLRIVESKDLVDGEIVFQESSKTFHSEIWPDDNSGSKSSAVKTTVNMKGMKSIALQNGPVDLHVSSLVEMLMNGNPSVKIKFDDQISCTLEASNKSTCSNGKSFYDVYNSSLGFSSRTFEITVPSHPEFEMRIRFESQNSDNPVKFQSSTLTLTDGTKKEWREAELTPYLSESEAWEYYKKELYPKQNTIGKASSLPWTKIDDQSIEQIRDVVNPAPTSTSLPR